MMLKKNFHFNIYNITHKQMVLSGVHLGGNYQNFDLSNTSVIYGIRTNNLLINLTMTSFELLKFIKMMELMGYRRKPIYYVYSSFGSKSIFKFFYGYYNKHLVFGKKLRYRSKKKVRFFKVRRRRYTFFRNSIFQKIFMSSNWFNGLLTNRRSFITYYRNEKKKKNIGLEYIRKYYFDRVPRIPHYAFIHHSDNSLINEFFNLKISHGTSGDVIKPAVYPRDFNIPSNSLSFETGNFYLAISLGAYLYGLYKKVRLFRRRRARSTRTKSFERIKLNFLFSQKRLFFKRFLLLDFFSL